MPLGSGRVRAVALLTAFVAVLVGVAVWGSAAQTSSPPAKRPVVKAAAAAAPAVPPKPAPPPQGLGAVAIPAKVAVYDAPDAPAPRQFLANPTWERMPLAFYVEERRDDWLHVRLNVRPNGSKGWIRASDVTLSNVPYRIRIDVDSNLLTLLREEEVLFQEPVAVGKPATPTPRGNFYVDAIVKTKNSAGVYGPYQISVGGFSEVLKTFGGGPGQIAVHGTNRPELIGKDVSNGCPRMENSAITRLVGMLAVGTPVEII